MKNHQASVYGVQDMAGRMEIGFHMGNRPLWVSSVRGRTRRRGAKSRITPIDLSFKAQADSGHYPGASSSTSACSSYRTCQPAMPVPRKEYFTGTGQAGHDKGRRRPLRQRKNVISGTHWR